MIRHQTIHNGRTTLEVRCHQVVVGPVKTLEEDDLPRSER